MKNKSTRATGVIPMEELPSQLVMQYFEEGIPITETPEHVILKKSNDAIRIQGDNLNLTARKIIDACFYIARQSLQAGTVPSSGTFSVSYDYFTWLVHYDSGNRQHLKLAFTSILQNPITISLPNPKNPEKDLFFGTNLLSDVCISGGRVYFTLPDSILQAILNPRSFTNLSLRIQNNFNSLYAYILYARCRLELYRGKTEWWEMSAFREMMNTKGLYKAFIDFHKRVIKESVDRINEKSDIFIVPDYQYRGRVKTHIRFFVEQNPNFVKRLDVEKLPNDVFEILKSEFGFSNSQVDEVASYPVEYVSEKIEFARYRISAAEKNNKPIKNPTAYLLNALREDLRFNENERVAFAKKQKALEMQAVEAEKQETVVKKVRAKKNALDAFNAMTEVEQKILLSEFEDSPAFEPVRERVTTELTAAFIAKNMIVRVAFTGWIQEREENVSAES